MSNHIAYLNRRILSDARQNSSASSARTDTAGLPVSVEAKYRDPATNETWSGRGRMANWLKRKQEAGEDIDKVSRVGDSGVLHRDHQLGAERGALRAHWEHLAQRRSTSLEASPPHRTMIGTIAFGGRCRHFTFSQLTHTRHRPATFARSSSVISVSTLMTREIGEIGQIAKATTIDEE